MKFLEVFEFSQLSSALSQVVNGVRIEAQIEAYSCKAGSDKKLYKSMDNIYAELATSPSPTIAESIASSPFGPMSETSSRKTFIFLVATLNASFSDYDFSNVKLEEFRNESNRYLIANAINTPLQSSLPNYSTIEDHLWATLDREITIRDCEIYSFLPDPDSDPFYEDGYIWSFNYFFYNRKMKRVVFFHSRAIRASDEETHHSTISKEISLKSTENSDSNWFHDPDMDFMDL